MKFNFIRLAALIIGSIITIWLAIMLFIIVAHLIEELSDGDNDPLFQYMDIYMMIFLVLSIVSLFIAWFKNKIGGFLISISAIGLIFSELDDLHLGRWPQYILLFSGILLLFYEYYNAGLLKKK